MLKLIQRVFTRRFRGQIVQEQTESLICVLGR